MTDKLPPLDTPSLAAWVADATVDALGLNCPLPILKAKKALNALQSGQILQISTSDPGAVRDFQAFARQTGNELLGQHIDKGNTTHFLRRR